jgi:hypothetical protein
MPAMSLGRVTETQWTIVEQYLITAAREATALKALP